MRKLSAFVVIVGVLSLQAKELVSPADGWYWPFMDYPMYSNSAEPGKVFHEFRYVIMACDTAAVATIVDYRAMGVKFFDFQLLLEEAAGANGGREIPAKTQNSAIEKLTRLSTVRSAEDSCRAGVEVRKHWIERGVGYQESPWNLERAWTLAP